MLLCIVSYSEHHEVHETWRKENEVVVAFLFGCYGKDMVSLSNDP